MPTNGWNSRPSQSSGPKAALHREQAHALAVRRWRAVSCTSSVDALGEVAGPWSDAVVVEGALQHTDHLDAAMGVARHAHARRDPQQKGAQAVRDFR